LALAGAGCHEQAVAIYPEAIEAQRQSWQRAPNSGLMQEILSKMYYNDGQSLVALQKWNDVALARREVWKKNGDRLLGVAVELAAIDQAVRSQQAGRSQQATTAYDSTHRDLTMKLDGDVIDTLRQAAAHGYSHAADLATDDRFAHLRNNERFAKLLQAQPGEVASPN
jgi:hypothetical protein